MTIQYIIKPKTEPIKLKNLNVTEFNNKPILFSIIGNYVVNTNKLSYLYCIDEIDLEYKYFFINASSCKMYALCYEKL